MNKIILTVLTLLLLTVSVSAVDENSTSNTNNESTNTTLSVCDHNADGIRNLVDVSMFAQCKDTFDANNDGVHDLTDLSLYAENNQNNTWCQQMFVCTINNVNNTNETSNIDFSFIIESPESKEYDGEIPVKIISNETLEEISFYLDNYTASCSNCSIFEDNLNLSEGNYTLVAKGRLENLTKEISVNFSVIFYSCDNCNNTNNTHNYSYNYTQNNSYSYRNSNGEPRFDLGYEKLPQLLEAGDISDEELAELIRESKINPGILNRLIKTGLLGEESLEAILDTQFKPQGMFSKILSIFGIKEESYAETVYENYELTKYLQQKMILRDDLSEDYKEKIKNNLKLEEKVLEGLNTGNTLYVGGQDNSGKRLGVVNSEDKQKELNKPDNSLGNKPENTGKGNFIEKNSEEISNDSSKGNSGKSENSGESGSSGSSNSGSKASSSNGRR